MLDRNSKRLVARKVTLADQGSDAEYNDLTPEQRILLVWPLTLTAWRFKEPNGVQQRLPRHVACVERR
jgi:hypothetical protein